MQKIAKLKRAQVCYVHYECDTPGPDVENGVLLAYWTGERDTWGKFTLQPVDGSDPLYLFPREIVGMEPL